MNDRGTVGRAVVSSTYKRSTNVPGNKFEEMIFIKNLKMARLEPGSSMANLINSLQPLITSLELYSRLIYCQWLTTKLDHREMYNQPLTILLL